MRIPFLVVALLPIAAATAQTQKIAWHPDNIRSGSSNAFPWGSAGLRYQTIVNASKFGNQPQVIQDILVSGDPNRGKLEVVYDDIEIRMGGTAQATVAMNWNANNPNPKTVYRGPLRVRFDPRQWQGIGLPSQYVYIPAPATPHLCIEIITWKVRGRITPSNYYYPYHGSGANRAWRYNWVNNQAMLPGISTTSGSKMGFLLSNGNFVTVGTGCSSSKSTTLEIGSSTFPQAKKPMDITLTGGKPLAPAVLMMGLSFTRFSTLNLPFDLAPFGAKGCFLWNDPTFLFPAATGASGAAKVTLVIPAGLSGARLYSHYWVHDPAANSFGWTTSSQGKILFGN
ncbi:MAG: hypothetical protein QGG14_10105 [Planctomycetota bacterium]|jgi:hypothetical protein|nr:hypothetical protein [Planctomycetota bacterium]